MGLWASEEAPSEILSFVSLGMVVLDELHFPDQQPLYDVVGGSGAYGTKFHVDIIITRLMLITPSINMQALWEPVSRQALQAQTQLDA